MQQVVLGLHPERVVLVTGGTNRGVEAIAQAAGRRAGLTVLGALVRELSPSLVAPESITRAMFVAENLYDKASGLYRLMRAHRDSRSSSEAGPL